MKNRGRYLLILIIILVLWDSYVIKPLKLFTVFLHELGHTLMAFLFGYGIKDFKVNFNESGYTLTQTKGWFSTFMVANGGYLGSVFFALLILYFKRTQFKKYILGAIALIFLGVSLKYSDLSFTLLYSILFAAFVLVLYMAGNEKLNEWIIDIIGISSAAYAVYDTFVDTILLQINLQLHLIGNWNPKQMTDAMLLSKLTHIPAIVWGIIWLAIAISAVNAILIKAPKGRKYTGSGGRP